MSDRNGRRAGELGRDFRQTPRSLSHPLRMIGGMFCDEVSIEHHDGTTECVDPTCTAPHDAHHLRTTCASLVPACSCARTHTHPHDHDHDLAVAA